MVISTPNVAGKSGTGLSWNSFGISHVGKVRRHNEDSMLERPDIGLWVVADGMGGHAKGDMASQMIVESLKKVHEGTSLARFIDDVEDRLLEVNERLLQKAKDGGRRQTIGSTVIIMIAYDRYCSYLWAGDSRLYRWRNGRLEQLTTDHSQVELYIEQGLMSREEATGHPHGNMITRAVGAAPELHLDTDVREMQAGDRYLLCSDGLPKHVSNREIENLLREGTAEQACKALIDLTLARGAQDNVTAIVIDIKSRTQN